VTSRLRSGSAILSGCVDAEQPQERVLNDGSRHRVHERYFVADALAEELGGEVVLDTDWFVAARVTW
jgi:hypothetical protein